MSIVQVSLTAPEVSDITEYINNYRSIHQSPALEYDRTISEFSINWSDYLLKQKLFQHSNSTKYGENLAYFNGYNETVISLVKR